MTITLTREEAQQVLDAFISMGQRAYDAMSGDAFHECNIAVSRLRARLAQPEIQQRTGECLLTGVCAAEGHRVQKAQPKLEPVAVVNEGMGGIEWLVKYSTEFEDKPLYFVPPQREWQGLTDEEISELIRNTHNTGSFVRAIEAKLKEKNT